MLDIINNKIKSSIVKINIYLNYFILINNKYFLN